MQEGLKLLRKQAIPNSILKLGASWIQKIANFKREYSRLMSTKKNVGRRAALIGDCLNKLERRRNHFSNTKRPQWKKEKCGRINAQGFGCVALAPAKTTHEEDHRRRKRDVFGR